MMSVTPVMKLCIVAKFKGFCKSVDFELIKREIILGGSESDESLESVRKILLALKQAIVSSITARK